MTMHRPTLSAALITFNEEANLRALLPKLSWTDEIVVVDGGSTDASREVARSFGARTIERPFRNFADQRNAAIDLTRGDWVLSIDADERPSALFEKNARTAIGGRMAAFRVAIRSSIFGRAMRFGGVQDDNPVRLFRRDSAVWTGDVHEVLRIKGGVGQLRAPLLHATMSDFETFLKKASRYTQLAARERVLTGKRPRRGARWAAAARETFRRLLWKQGYLDGPEGWAFCLLSGVSEWVTCDRHRRRWQEQAERMTPCAEHGRRAA